MSICDLVKTEPPELISAFATFLSLIDSFAHNFRFERRFSDADGTDGFSRRRIKQLSLFDGVIHVQYDVIYGPRPSHAEEQRHGSRSRRRRRRQRRTMSRFVISN